MTNRHSQSMLEAEGVPQVVFQRDRCGPIASAVVCKNEDVLGMWVLLDAVALPPGEDGICGEGRCIVTGADTYHSSIDYRVVNAIGAGFGFCIGRKIMIGNVAVTVAPHTARIFEVADELLFLCVNADDRLALPGKAFAGAADMAELEVPLFALML